MAEAAKAIKNEKIGQVVSTKMAKSIVVEVTRRVPHPLYKRIIAKRKKFYATTRRARRNWATRSGSSSAGRSAS